LIEEWDGKKHSDANVNHFSSTYAINFTQTNSHTSGPLTVGTTIMGGGPNVTRCGPSHTLARSKTHNSSTIAIMFDTVLHCLPHLHCCFILRHWFTMSSPSAQPMNHFHSRTIIKDSAPNLRMPQQTMASMYGQGYTHTTPSFTIPNPILTPYTFGFNGRAYFNPSSNF
jgi:hypothetical protein